MKDINIFAPIAITTLNRYAHFKRCISSLKKCTHSESTVLYIGLDYPSKEQHWDGFNKINEFLETITGFKEIYIIRRDKNYGALNNKLDLDEVVFRKYDHIIKIEDDSEFSVNFLDYLNRGFTKFEENENIYAICGFNGLDDISTYKNKYYFNRNFVAWGYGIWKNRYERLYWEPKKASIILEKKDVKSKLKKFSPHYYYYILNRLKNDEPLYGDMIVPLSNINNNSYCVFPKVSLIKNHGFDGSGVHCGDFENNKIYEQIRIDTNDTFDFSENVPVAIDPLISSSFRKRNKLAIKTSIKQKIKHSIIGNHISGLSNKNKHS